MNDLGLVLKTMGDYEKALPLYVEGLDGRREKFGDQHPKTLTSLNNLGALYYVLGRVEEAEPLAIEALEGWKGVSLLYTLLYTFIHTLYLLHTHTPLIYTHSDVCGRLLYFYY